MGWVETIPQWGSNTFNITPDGHMEYKASWVVVFNEQEDGGSMCVGQSGIPAYKSSYVFGNDSNPFAFCNGLSVDPYGEGLTWLVTASYTTDTEEHENPIDRPAVQDWDWTTGSKPLNFDKDGNPVLNGAKDFLAGAEMDDSRPVVTYTKNVAWDDWNPVNADQWRDAINSSQFGVFPALTAKIMGLGASQQETMVQGQKYKYWTVRLTIAFNRDTWILPFVNLGFREIVDEEKRQIKIDGEFITTPVELDANGAQLPLDGVSVPIEVHAYKEMDFSALASLVV